ncbi:hypothetical protein B005_2545 [Nocardiopsis alba ATCC BAA-2165]|uniref:Uncharacterized protein n=1 Tax=Nocardiopsis alba (strain ATCC BAA-2165 / BE74) TaxID=1205910 RepID=J7LCT5_NOCAA|nr:hypothetical protein B005_2545 [Nocardiopsis alba ATCC BAA-2165]
MFPSLPRTRPSHTPASNTTSENIVPKGHLGLFRGGFGHHHAG